MLNKITHPSDLKNLSLENLSILAKEIRERIITVTSENGGHVGPNLGVVELTLALHYVFNTPKDKFIFDVAHQGYVHKLLTGRNGSEFDNIRKSNGVSGFLTREESPHDCYGAGHAGTALSAALGIAKARDFKGNDDHVVAILGDAAFTCGITMEALNNITTTTKRLIIVLNDNEWSISKNVGAIAKYLNDLITNPIYNRLHKDLESFLEKIPGGQSIIKFGSKAKRETKDLFVPSSLFEKYGIRYIGPIDGHNQKLLIQYLEFTKQSEQPIVLHVLTKKGHGYQAATNNPAKFHGTGPFIIDSGQNKESEINPIPKYENVFGDHLLKFAKENPKILAITAAMPSGTGLSNFHKELPEQFFDVGIAEEHAVLFAAGLATEGFKPVCAIYSTFLQRGFDPIVHDICLQNLNVLFCMDRAGLSPNDGPTHHGLFDIAYLRPIPRVVLMQPKNEDELVDMMHTCLGYQGPTFIRYPRGQGEGVPIKEKPQLLEIGKAEIISEGADIMIWALGPMIKEAMLIADYLEKNYNISTGVVNPRFIKPLDKELILEQAQKVKLIVTIEDHVVTSGFGSALLETLQEAKIQLPVERIGWPDNFISHGSNVQDLRNKYGLSTQAMLNKILNAFESIQERLFLNSN
ncbi:MAG: 1-deoxy-D-xylulose-5-phosphate synthase [Verrucomicrobia bacterium]|nr:MAG: 1-deoxy-D-xylulose-5-phosphate synthase [Verrucomicrobiota bacterium]